MCRLIVVTAILMLACAPAHAQSPSRGSGLQAIWMAVGAGAGFGVGLWAGLTAYDDAVNSDRKVWTSAVVGAAVGGMTGYLIGRTRRGRTRPATTRLSPRDWPTDATLARELARSVRFGRTAPVDGSSPDQIRSTQRRSAQ
jgi:hypothetical protein